MTIEQSRGQEPGLSHIKTRVLFRPSVVFTPGMARKTREQTGRKEMFFYPLLPTVAASVLHPVKWPRPGAGYLVGGMRKY